MFDYIGSVVSDAASAAGSALGDVGKTLAPAANAALMGAGWICGIAAASYVIQHAGDVTSGIDDARNWLARQLAADPEKVPHAKAVESQVVA